MNADLLCEAAALMRDRAKRVPEQSPVEADVMGVWLNSRYYLTTPPAVALAVADWLDAPGCACTPCGCCGIPVTCDESCSPFEAALTVARAYLGRDA